MTVSISGMHKDAVFSQGNSAFPSVDYIGFTLYIGSTNHHYSKEEILHRLNYEGLVSYEENGRVFIEDSLKHQAEIVFEVTVASDMVKYPMFIKSDVFDFKVGSWQVEEHKGFARAILSRIKGKKRGYYIINGKEVPIPKLTWNKQVKRRSRFNLRKRFVLRKGKNNTEKS
jgi:hypothetical protein